MLVYDVHIFYYFSIYWSDTSLWFGQCTPNIYLYECVCFYSTDKPSQEEICYA